MGVGIQNMVSVFQLFPSSASGGTAQGRLHHGVF